MRLYIAKPWTERENPNEEVRATMIGAKGVSYIIGITISMNHITPQTPRDSTTNQRVHRWYPSIQLDM